MTCFSWTSDLGVMSTFFFVGVDTDTPFRGLFAGVDGFAAVATLPLSTSRCASSAARRQMSSARLASPDSEATFLATNWIASLSKTDKPDNLELRNKGLVG